MAVVFRRGPSKRVLLVFWRTDRDAFFPGQWLKGRIYERRCDLSPSGERLIYFCGQYHKPLATWTAVSRPPYLTALALWPKGDTWGGGGLFADENTILLDHGRREAALAEGFQLPPEIRVLPQEEAWGEGERRSIEELRLCRDGWTLESTGHMVVGEIGAPIKFRYERPQVWRKPRGAAEDRWALAMRILGHGERGGPWDVTEYSILDGESGRGADLGRLDWADWCHSGDLLFAREGMLFRLNLNVRAEAVDPVMARPIADFRDLRFEPRQAPQEARSWHGPLERNEC